MAAAAQMAAPPGAPGMPKPIDAAPQPQQGADPMEAQRVAAEKDSEIAKLQGQLNEAKLEVEKERTRAEIQAEQRKAEDNLRKEQAALDKKRTESAAAEERHRANLERETARQQMQVAKAEADATVNIAQRDAESIKATADANAKDYVKMTEAARKDVDSYRASQQAAIDKYNQEARKNNPYVSAGLQTQLDSALAAAHNVGKLRKRLAKNASAPAPQPQPQQQPAPASAPVNATPGAGMSEEQKRIAAQNRMIREQANAQTRADHRLARIGDKVSMQGNLVNRHKEILTAEANLNRLKSDPNSNPADIMRWQEALDTARQAYSGYEQQINERAAQGDARAKEEVAQFKDFTQQRQTSGGATFANMFTLPGWAARAARFFGAEGVARGLEEIGSLGASNYQSEADDYAQAAAKGLTPEQVKQIEEQGKGFWGHAADFVTDPFVGLGDAVNGYNRSKQLAANRGIDMQWFDSDYQGAAGDAYEEALRQRNLNGTIMGNAGNIGLNAGVAALDTLGNIALVTGVGSGVGAALKGVGAAARGVSMANKAYKAGQIGRAAMKTGWNAAKDTWRDMGVQAAKGAAGNSYGLAGRGYQGIQNTVGRLNNSTAGRVGNMIGWGTMAGTGAAIGGQLMGTNKLNFLSPHMMAEQNRALSGIPSGMRVAADGSVLDAAGTNHGQYVDASGNAYGYDQYRQMNPNYVQLMNDPRSAGYQAGMAKTANAWQEAGLNPGYNPATPYNTTGLGRMIGFASPHVTSFTKGMVNLAPAHVMPKSIVGQINFDPNNAVGAIAQQSSNPLFNANARNSRGGMIDHLIEMRKQVVAHPLNNMPMTPAPLYNQMIS
jgi:hypothetical protein